MSESTRLRLKNGIRRTLSNVVSRLPSPMRGRVRKHDHNWSNETAAVCFSVALSDSTWQRFGYRKMPQMNAGFRSFCVPWKVELERAILREVSIIMFSTYLSRGDLNPPVLAATISHWLSFRGTPRSLGYSSAQDAQRDYLDQVYRYASLAACERGAHCCARLNVQAIPESALVLDITRGCAQIAALCEQVAESMRPGHLFAEMSPVSVALAAEHVQPPQNVAHIEAIAILARKMASEVSASGAQDTVDGGIGAFGTEVTNPVPVCSIADSSAYLKRLRWRSESITWVRVGSFGSRNIKMPIDGYDVRAANGKPIGRIYIYPYHCKTSNKAPDGYWLMET
jgi:hypothetical protein